MRLIVALLVAFAAGIGAAADQPASGMPRIVDARRLPLLDQQQIWCIRGAAAACRRLGKLAPIKEI